MSPFEDGVFEKLLEALTVNDRVVCTSQDFSELKTNEERVALAYQLLDGENLLPECNSCRINKSQETATYLRNQGNIAFQKRNDSLALKLYNQSLACAPLNTEAYALAVANRSAVNIALRLYEACLSDIDQALSHGYPHDLRLKLLKRRAKCYICLCKRPEAEASIKEIEEELKKSVWQNLSALESDLKTLVKELEEMDLLNRHSDELRTSTRYFRCSELPSLTYGFNNEIECASDCISLRFSENCGRHLVTTRDIFPGDVLIVEPPYASILLPKATKTHCSYCLRYCLSPVPCLYCTEVLFCHEDCRYKSWENFHSVDCPLTSLLSQSVSPLGLLALRVLMVASKKGVELSKLFNEVKNVEPCSDPRTLGFSCAGRYSSSEYWPIHYLIGHTSRRGVADLFKRSVTAACLLHSLKELTDFFSPEMGEELHFFAGGLLLHYLQSLPCNAHEVSEMNIKARASDAREIGAAAYATLSLINHSCDPNVVRHSYKDWAVLRAIRPIKAGEELFDNYGYHHALHGLEDRRTKLFKQYFFHCLCEACEGCWPLYKNQPIEKAVYRCTCCGEGLAREEYEHINVQCHTCGSMTNVKEMDELIKQSSKVFRENLLGFLDGHQKRDVLSNFLTHLNLLGRTIQRPWREFSECQEAIKQCLSLESNHIVFMT